MRSSVSCDSCRRAKVKCNHAGSPPCRRCDKSGIKGCTLTRPQVSSARKRLGHGTHGVDASIKAKANTPTASSATLNAESRTSTAQQSTTEHEKHRDKCDIDDVVTDADDGVDLEAMDWHIASLPKGIALKTLNVFLNKFPELSILHLPTFMSNLDASASSSLFPRESKALLAAVLAATRAQLTILGAPWADSLLSSHKYAAYARKLLAGLILQRPRLQVVQALLVITLHEWGSRDFHKAWVYCGIAIRIMQAIHSLRVAPLPLEPLSERDGRRRDDSADAQAVETRTYWACFIMDSMVNSGTYNPPMLPMSEMRKLKIPRPPSSVEFAFGPEPRAHGTVATTPASDVEQSELSSPATAGVLDITQNFEILVNGFSIWAQVNEFVFNDGRKAPGMCAPQNCPWVPGSPWFNSRNQLREWRAKQHRNLHYPNTPVAAHMTLGYGETFTYLNLLYYVSVLMLYREYTPFLPTPESVPRGPVDHPVLEAPAPPGWWENGAAELHGAAEQIARVLHEASECGVHLMTPFAGFCAFSAGYVLIYVYHFPNMNLGRSPHAEECMNMCLDYLAEFRKVWKIADGWMKTLQQATLLYGRAATTDRYRGRSRANFGNLHQSVHEFRVVDRSDQHSREIDGADRARTEFTHRVADDTLETSSESLDTNALLNQFLVEVGSNADEQGPWSQWWPLMEEVDSGMSTLI